MVCQTIGALIFCRETAMQYCNAAPKCLQNGSGARDLPFHNWLGPQDESWGFRGWGSVESNLSHRCLGRQDMCVMVWCKVQKGYKVG